MYIFSNINFEILDILICFQDNSFCTTSEYFTNLSLVTKKQFAPPVSSTLVRVWGSRYKFSLNPSSCAFTIGYKLIA